MGLGAIRPRKALEGVKVLDFSWVVVGPTTVRHLADHGATVIRIESAVHPDPLRTLHPFRDNQPGLDRSAYSANYAAGKYSVSLNLEHPKGAQVGRRLATDWADVVVESYAPG